MPSPTPRPAPEVHQIRESSIFEQHSNFAIVEPLVIPQIVIDLIWRDGDPPFDIEAPPDPFPLKLVITG